MWGGKTLVKRFVGVFFFGCSLQLDVVRKGSVWVGLGWVGMDVERVDVERWRGERVGGGRRRGEMSVD